MSFSIDAGIFTLKNNSKKDKTILNRGIKYTIPIYQRPYSWKEEQIGKFISDLFLSFWGYDKEKAPEPLFIGTMQLSGVEDHTREIIDGQQRLTTLFILLKVLGLKYPENEELQALGLDWIKTEVSLGAQQDYLTALIELSTLEQSDDHQLNPYIENAHLISQLVEQHIAQETPEDPVFDFPKFLDHLSANILFAVIETNAGLSKTLQIFDAINTTGLDLNTGDLFKIRMYEYLKMEGAESSAFEDISALYGKIDTGNEALNLGWEVVPVTSILTLYQHYLIARYELPVVLYSYAVETFYQRLFDTIFNVRRWEHFQNNVENGKVKLCLKELERMIDIRFDWETRWRNNNYGSPFTLCVLHILSRSRYSRFRDYIHLVLFRIAENELPGEADYERMYAFTEKLNRLYLLYSVVYQKAVNRISTGFNSELLHALVHEGYEEAMAVIDKRWEESQWEKEQFRKILEGTIVYNPKVKYLLCWLSASLEEVGQKDKDAYEAVREMFFEPVDIEHIQSFHDENEQLRESIWNEYGEDIHSIGNLVILERHLNRSINNREAEKMKKYQESKFSIVKDKLVSQYGQKWELDQCLQRKATETEKICDYLFQSVEASVE
ncbi:DUF262 domain-containing protein [Persicobacter sp. CCB-QB2]|uniref:DUF262 domain-containing protein n=1 Tax=Persicobacter sp. CCB-QB2 TaxID=1561025 RepID=UPI0006A9A4C8|nr:DUF262 domain-containing protein [Persicobacter sp. CCB-QB2]